MSAWKQRISNKSFEFTFFSVTLHGFWKGGGKLKMHDSSIMMMVYILKPRSDVDHESCWGSAPVGSRGHLTYQDTHLQLLVMYVLIRCNFHCIMYFSELFYCPVSLAAKQNMEVKLQLDVLITSSLLLFIKNELHSSGGVQESRGEFSFLASLIREENIFAFCQRLTTS